MPDRSTMSPAERARAWREGLSVSTDHVYPKSSNVGLQPNTVAAHIRCNSLKGNRMPTGCELIWLEAVNARLGREA